MFEIKYWYLLGNLVFILIWLYFFIKRKDLRKEIILMGLLSALGSLFTAYFFWTIDWWKPLTLSGTRVGIEDLILGFTNGGIVAVLFETFYKKRNISKHPISKIGFIRAISILGLLMSLLTFLFYGLQLTSFWSCFAPMILAVLPIWIIRRDLIKDSLVSAVIMLLIAIPAYIIPEILSPGGLDKFWIYNSLTNIRILGIPIEDLIFYFLFGLLWGPFYEFITQSRQYNINDKKLKKK